MEQILEADYTNSLTDIQAEGRRDALTLERLLYAGALAVAFGLRFVSLGAAPLNPLEAAQAWPAWLAATGTQVPNAPAPTSALFYALQSTLFFLTGGGSEAGGDVLARLLPALLGTALVLLPWWWRSWLGRGAALTAAFLLALDPWLVALSRTSDPAALTIGLGLLALTALWQWQACPHVGVRATPESMHADAREGAQASSPAGWERTLAVSLGLLLVSGPLTWSWLPVLALFWWYCTRTPARGRAGYAGVRRSTWVWFAAALLLGASGFLAWPGAFGAVGSSLSAWIGQWRGDSGLGIGWPFVRLAVDQPLLLVFGPLGLILLAVTGLSLRRTTMPQGRAASSSEGAAHPLTRSPAHPLTLALFLALWAAWGLLLLLLPGRSAAVLPMLGLPLLIAASWAIGYLLALPLEDVTGVEITVLLGVAAILFAAGSIWLALAVESAAYDTRLALTALSLVVLMLAIWLVFGFWAGWRAAGKLAGLFFAAVLLLLSVRSGWQLAQTGGRMAPDGFFAVTTLPEASLLPADVQRISSIRFGDPYEAPVQAATGGEAPNALLGWLLRDMRNLTWVAAPDAAAVLTTADGSTRPPLIVAPQSMEQNPGLGGLIGSTYPLTMRWDPSMLPALPPADQTSDNGLPPEELAKLRSDQAWSQATRPRLEWLLYRTISNEPPIDSVTLWATP